MPNSLRVIVPWHYARMAATRGITELCVSQAACMRDSYPNAAIWQTACVGFIGEAAVALALDLAWPDNIGTFGQVPDVPPYQVRTTSVPSPNPHLSVSERDNPLHPFMLVRYGREIGGVGIECFLLGECMGWYAQQPDYWENSRRVYWVPSTKLRDPGTYLQEEMEAANDYLYV